MLVIWTHGSVDCAYMMIAMHRCRRGIVSHVGHMLDANLAAPNGAWPSAVPILIKSLSCRGIHDIVQQSILDCRWKQHELSIEF